jgi:3-hydroxymyristoyl/3-hydroxydecanoyl-(acyl carrier protein) dehydratase
LTPELAARVRSARRRLLFDPAAVAPLPEPDGLVERLLPHRGSMLLVDRLVGMDPQAGRIVGARRVAADDPVFVGHFPGDPLYPGALQIEAVGQCGLCLHPLLRTGGAAPPAGTEPAGVRLVRVLAAEFLEPVRPGAEALLLAELIEDGLTIVTLGQMVVDGRPTCACAFEAIVLDGEAGLDV